MAAARPGVPGAFCPEFIAGSHSSGTLYYPRLFIDQSNYAEGAEGFESVPDIDANRQDYDVLSWELAPGDCIVFHMRTIHGAPRHHRPHHAPARLLHSMAGG